MSRCTSCSLGGVPLVLDLLLRLLRREFGSIFFAHTPAACGTSGNSGKGLGWFGGFALGGGGCRMVSGHSNISSEQALLWSGEAVATSPPTLLGVTGVEMGVKGAEGEGTESTEVLKP
jgi:hypothetical protein